MTRFGGRAPCAAIFASLVNAAAVAAAQAVPVTFTATFSGLVYDRATASYNSVLTLRNQGATALYAPLLIVMATGTTAVTVKGTPDGKTQVVASLADGSLLPTEPVNIPVAFADPTRVTFTPRVTSVTAASAPAGLGITVTTPTAGQVPAGPTFVVMGTLAASGVAGASLDGVPACLNGAGFFVNAFQPQISPGSFTAAATDIDGGQQTLSVGISPASKGLRVTPAPACGGVAPFTTTVTVSLDTGDGDTIATEKIDFGAGAGPSAVSPGVPVSYVYANPGLYTVTATATTAQGATLKQIALVLVRTSAQAYAPMLRNVALLQTALGAHNVIRALSYLTGTSQQRYAPLLTQTGINLGGIASVLATAQPRALAGAYAELVISATTANGAESSSIVLVPDGSGIWRIDSW